MDKLLYATTFKISPKRQAVILTYLCYTDENNVVLSEEHKEYLWASKLEMKRYLANGIIADFEENNIFMLEDII